MSFFLSLSLSLFHARAWARFNFPGVSLPFFRTFFAYEYNSAGPWIFVASRDDFLFPLPFFCPTNWLSSDCRSKRDRCSNICFRKRFGEQAARRGYTREHLNYGLEACVFSHFTSQAIFIRKTQLLPFWLVYIVTNCKFKRARDRCSLATTVAETHRRCAIITKDTQQILERFRQHRRHLKLDTASEITESDLRAENKAENEKLLVLSASVNMRLIRRPLSVHKIFLPLGLL